MKKKYYAARPKLTTEAEQAQIIELCTGAKRDGSVNPRRKPSRGWNNWELYTKHCDGKTVAYYEAMGGLLSFLRTDIQCGHIVLKPPSYAIVQEQQLASPVAAALRSMSAKDLLDELRQRGGTLRAVAEAQLLVLKKSADYNQAGMAAQTDEAAAQADRDIYFPFGSQSYAQMVHVKAQRLNSLVLKELAGLPPNHESICDTLRDIINYASFWIERIDRESKPGNQVNLK